MTDTTGLSLELQDFNVDDPPYTYDEEYDESMLLGDEPTVRADKPVPSKPDCNLLNEFIVSLKKTNKQADIIVCKAVEHMKKRGVDTTSIKLPNIEGMCFSLLQHVDIFSPLVIW